MQNKYTIMSDIFVGESLSIDKYEPNKVANGLNHATFFVASDDIDVMDLQRYREQNKTEYLIAIKTSNKYFNCLNIADNIIECLPNEIELVVAGLEYMAKNWGFIGMDWQDITTAISSRRNIQFIQSYAVGENCVSKASDEIVLKLHQIKSDERLAAVLINTFGGEDFDFGEFEIITTKTQSNLNIAPENMVYQISFCEEFD